jgi:hypothetical protein
MRVLAIALFSSVDTAVGGLAAPALFGVLLETGRADLLLWGYLAGAALMLLAAAAEVVLGVDAEGKPLEDVAAPLAAERPDAPQEPRHPRERASARAVE